MSFTTASGLLPAGTAVYVQREPNGVHLETRYSVGLEGFTSQSETRWSNSLLPSWEAGSSGGVHQEQSTYGLSSRTAMFQKSAICAYLHSANCLLDLSGNGIDCHLLYKDKGGSRYPIVQLRMPSVNPQFRNWRIGAL